MRLEDRYSGEMGGVEEFNFEHFVEGSLRNMLPEEDLRDFKYADIILRPRHLIQLWEALKPATAEIFTARSPVVIFDGESYEISSVRTDTFDDLIKFVEDLTQSNSQVLLYSVSRTHFIDPTTFKARTSYLIRTGIIN